MWINFLWALIPILWLIISLGIIGMSASRACTIGLIITIADAVLMFKQPLINTLSGALSTRLQLNQGVCRRLKRCYRLLPLIKEF